MTATRTVVVRYETTPETAEENARLVAAVYAELAQTEPDGLRYASFRLADGVSFLHVAVHDEQDNPLTRVAAFAQFQRELGSRVVAPPQAGAATVVGSYRFV